MEQDVLQQLSDILHDTPSQLENGAHAFLCDIGPFDEIQIGPNIEYVTLVTRGISVDDLLEGSENITGTLRTIVRDICALRREVEGLGYTCVQENGNQTFNKGTSRETVLADIQGTLEVFSKYGQRIFADKYRPA